MREDGKSTSGTMPWIEIPMSVVALPCSSCRGWLHFRWRGRPGSRGPALCGTRRAVARRVETCSRRPASNSDSGEFWWLTAKPARRFMSAMPISCSRLLRSRKLFSTAAALVELGPNHRFQTPLVGAGRSTSRGRSAAI